MSLPNDVSRCDGQAMGGPACALRDACRRYTEPKPANAWYLHPQIPGPCAYYLPAAGPVERDSAEPEQDPSP